MSQAPILEVVRRFHPEVQAVYLFGSYGTEFETPESDVDLALLLPHEKGGQRGGPLLLDDCFRTLRDLLARHVDLINLRLADTVFQNEILRTGRLLLSQDEAAHQNFEMLTLSLYQKLQEERKDILQQIHESKRVYNV